MIDTLVAHLKRLPPRQVHLLCGGALLLLVAALWSVLLRAPLAQLSAGRAETARLTLLPADARALDVQNAALTQQIAKLETSMGLSASGVGLDQRQLDLIATVNRAARAHGVQVLGAMPAPLRVVAGFNAMSLDVNASGGYQPTLDWIADIEAALPNVAVVQLEMTRPPAGADLEVRMTLAVYLPIGGPP